LGSLFGVGVGCDDDNDDDKVDLVVFQGAMLHGFGVLISSATVVLD
jgi:hypothetical protein